MVVDRDILDEDPEIVVDTFHAHEALDRTSMIADMFDQYVLSAPFVAQNSELRGIASAALDGLGLLYQSIATASDKQFP